MSEQEYSMIEDERSEDQIIDLADAMEAGGVASRVMESIEESLAAEGEVDPVLARHYV